MRPKRSLGQNFLTNVGIARKMADLASVGPEDTVVEVGPGRGMLTRVLLERAGRVTAVEKDDELFGRLRDAFRDEDRLVLIHADVLELDLGPLIAEGAKVVANLPYNIATGFIVQLLDACSRFGAAQAVLMLQKEVASRICAGPGQREYSALSVLVASCFTAGRGFTVSPANFFPRPKVDSRVVSLHPKTTFPTPGEMELLKTVLRCAFSKRRKVLGNNLVHLQGMDQSSLEALARDAGVYLGLRPQDLPFELYLSFGMAYGSFIGELQTRQ
jgi:16S rRNA (adenine1518-N6/adenine1519-N6)-dimethyltransferase